MFEELRKATRNSVTAAELDEISAAVDGGSRNRGPVTGAVLKFGCVFGLVGVVLGIYYVATTSGDNYFSGMLLILLPLLLTPIGLIVGLVWGIVARHLRHE